MTSPRPFPRVFWVALLLEFFERLAFYGVFVNLKIYLTDTVLLSDIDSGYLMGVFAFVRSLVPLATGVLADRIGFRRSLTLSFVLYALSYTLLFFEPTRSGAWTAVMGMAVAGAFLKPVIPAAVRRYSPEERRRDGFSYFYASVNAGSVVGKIATKLVRTMSSVRGTIINAIVACVIGLTLALTAFREPPPALSSDPPPGEPLTKEPGSPYRGTTAEVPRTERAPHPLADLARAFMNIDLALVPFLLLIAGYYLLIEQFYQTFPTHAVRVLGEDAPREYITLINPAAIALFQVSVGRLTAKIPAPYTMAVSVVVASASMLLMGAVPTIAGACGAYFVFAIAEMGLGPRYYEYVSSFAPKGREGMYMGIAIVPVGLGGLIGGVLSGRLIDRYLPKGGPHNPLAVWGTYAAIGVVCAALLGAYAVWIQRRRAAVTA